MKSILLPIILLPLCLWSQKSPNLRHPEKRDFYQELVYSPYDLVVSYYIPLSNDASCFKIPGLASNIQTHPDYATGNLAVLSTLPALMVKAINSGKCEAIGRFTISDSLGRRKTVEKALPKNSISQFARDLILTQTTALSDKNDMDSVIIPILSRLMEIRFHVRDSMGTIIYKPLRLTLLADYADLGLPMADFCIADLNQPFFTQPVSENKSFYDIIQERKWVGYAVRYWYRSRGKIKEADVYDIRMSDAIQILMDQGIFSLLNPDGKKSDNNLLFKSKMEYEQELKSWKKVQKKYGI